MFTTPYPAMLPAPAPGAMPCFRLPEFDLDGLQQRTRDERCTAVTSTATATAPSLAGTPVAPSEAPRSSLPLFDTRQARKPRMKWTARCTQILVANASEFTNLALVELIEAETGLRFSLDTVNTRRALLGLDPPGRNQWTSPLRRWRPWQGGKLS